MFTKKFPLVEKKEHLFLPLVSKASREVANLTERKNPDTPVILFFFHLASLLYAVAKCHLSDVLLSVPLSVVVWSIKAV